MFSIFHGMFESKHPCAHILFTCLHLSSARSSEKEKKKTEKGPNEIEIHLKWKRNRVWGIFMNLSNRKIFFIFISCFVFRVQSKRHSLHLFRRLHHSLSLIYSAVYIKTAYCFYDYIFFFSRYDDIQCFVVVFRSIKMKRRWVNNLCRFKFDDNHIYFWMRCV